MPCVDSVSATPPMTPAQNVYGREIEAVKSNTRNLPAADPARTTSVQPPGIDESSDTRTTAAPARYTNNCTTSVQMTADAPPRTVYTIMAPPMTSTAHVTGT